MKYRLDTTAYSALNRDDGRLRKVFADNNELIVVGELRAGFIGDNQTARNEKLLQRFLDSPAVSTITITDKTTQLFAHTHHILKRAGRPIGTNDLWIAALTLEHDLPLVTLDTNFTDIPTLQLALL